MGVPSEVPNLHVLDHALAKRGLTAFHCGTKCAQARRRSLQSGLSEHLETGGVTSSAECVQAATPVASPDSRGAG